MESTTSLISSSSSSTGVGTTTKNPSEGDNNEETNYRPRTGRKHTDILGPVEAETPDAVKGTPVRAIRETLLNLGRPVRSEPLRETLWSQAIDIDTHYAQEPKNVIEAIFEW